MNAQNVKALWLEVFPKSDAVCGSVLGSEYVKLYLLPKSEVANGIRENDPLSYTVWIEGDKVSEQSAPYLTIKATLPHMAYGGVKMRKMSTIKADKLRARFQAVRQFIIDHRAEWYCDISGKVQP